MFRPIRSWPCPHASNAAQTVRAMSIGIYRDALDEEVFYLLDYAGAKAVLAEAEASLLIGADRLVALAPGGFHCPAGTGPEPLS